jgi:hypothetical protein
MHCKSEKMNVGLLWVERNAINDSPDYQRESGVWNTEKQQLFIDSIINSYDVPKLYFHDLRSQKMAHKFAIIDGKQRLHAIWQFVGNHIPLADDFKCTSVTPAPYPQPGNTFSAMSETWREVFKSRALDVVLVQNADEEDIDELFSRLNNGEPLNAAEKRNAKGGEMTKLIRDVAAVPALRQRLPFSNRRYAHYEVAAKILLIENNITTGGDGFCDLKKRFLDKLADDNKKMPQVKRDQLMERVHEQLKVFRRVFGKNDALLAKQAYPPLYYLFVRTMVKEYADKKLYSRLATFLTDFQGMRAANLSKPEDERDPVIIEFGRLMQQGTNDVNSLRARVSILRRYFLLANPDVAIRDKKRTFTEEERTAIWILGGKQCAVCSKPLPLDEMQADHHIQWAHGGATTLENGRCLCENCNQVEASGVA